MRIIGYVKNSITYPILFFFGACYNKFGSGGKQPQHPAENMPKIGAPGHRLNDPAQSAIAGKGESADCLILGSVRPETYSF